MSELCREFSDRFRARRERRELLVDLASCWRRSPLIFYFLFIRPQQQTEQKRKIDAGHAQEERQGSDDGRDVRDGGLD